MNHFLAFLVAVLASAAPASAWAHANAVEMASDTTVEVLKKFETEEAASIPSFLGVKVWPNGNVFLAKVYLTNNGVVNYECRMMTMNGSEMVMCDKK
jgi:hypothetical protein